MTNEQDWIAVAVITRPHALSGGLLLKPFTRTVDEFFDVGLQDYQIRRHGRIEGKVHLKNLTTHKGLPLIFLEGVSSRTEAEKYIGAELVIPKDQLWELEEGRYYIDDLIGLKIVDHKSHEEISQVDGVMEGTAHDLLIFKNPDNPDKEVYLPIVPEFVLSVDLDKEIIEVTLPEGLLEL